jgi:hypothetical protein
MLFAVGAFGRRHRDGLRHGDLHLRRPLVQHDVDRQRSARNPFCTRFDAGQQVQPDPAQHMVVRGEQHQLVAALLSLEGLDPGVELLGRQLLLEFSGERRPERIHGL